MFILRFSASQFVEEIYFFVKGSFKVLGSFFIDHTFSSFPLQFLRKQSDFLLGLFAARIDDLFHFLNFLFISKRFSSFLVDLLFQEEEFFFVEIALSGEFLNNASEFSFLFSDLIFHSSDVIFIFLFFLFVVFENPFEFLSFPCKGL